MNSEINADVYNKIKNMIDDNKLLQSEGFKSYLLKIARGVTGNYQISIDFGNEISRDGVNITVNPNHPYLKSIDNTEDMMLCVLGQMSHELFHIIYTDDDAVKKCIIKTPFTRRKKMIDCIEMIEDKSADFLGASYYCGLKKALNKYYANIVDNEKNNLLLYLNNKPDSFILQKCIELYIEGFDSQKLLKNEFLADKYHESINIIDSAKNEKTTLNRINFAENLYEIISETAASGLKHGKQFGVYREYKYLCLDNSKPSPKKEKSGIVMYDDSNYKKSKYKPFGLIKLKIRVDANESDINSNAGIRKLVPAADMFSDNIRNYYGNSNFSDFNLDIDRIKDDTAIEIYNDMDMAKKDAQIIEFGKNVKYGELHKNIKTQTIRNFAIDENVKNFYNEKFEPVKNLTINLQKNLKDIFKSSTDDRIDGFYSGKINVRYLYRLDKKYFYRIKEKQTPNNTAILVLVDLSGSMHGERVNYARLACMMLYEVCKELKIPYAVIGHSAVYKEDIVIHKHFIDFNSKNKDEKYNLFYMQDHGNTREGVSLKYAGEYLLKQPELNKILFSISDGQPNHTAKNGLYANEVSKNDTARVVKELTQTGIKVFGIAIGNEKSKLKEIYLNNYIDVPNITSLPAKLVDLLQRNIVFN